MTNKHNRFRKLPLLFITLLLVLPLLVACSGGGNDKGNDKGDNINDTVVTDEDLIKERVETFLTAYNQGDMDAVLKCLDAKSRNAMQAMLNLLGGIAGSQLGFTIDLKDLFSLGVSMAPDDYMKLKVSDINIIDEKNAVATTTMEVTGMNASISIYFTMVRENGGWYISNMSEEPPTASSGGSSGGNSDTSVYHLTTYANTDLAGTAGTYTSYNQQQFHVGDTVVLEAAPNDGFNFEGWYTTSGWSVVCLSEYPRYEFQMGAADQKIEARFSYYTVTTSSWSDDYGQAGTYTQYDEKKISVGDTVTLTATVNAGYNFEGWYQDDILLSKDLTYTFEMKAENVNIEAAYSYYTVSVTGVETDSGLAGTFTEKDAEKVSLGETVTLTATVNEGYNFEGWYHHWTGVCLSDELTYTFEMKAENLDIEAVYSHYTVTTFSYSNEYNTAGTYTEYDEKKISVGDTVTLTATIADGYNFEGWYNNGVLLSKDLIYTFTMKAENIFIEAAYSCYTVTTYSDTDEYGTAGTYTEYDGQKIRIGETVTVTATVKSGYRFEGWYRNGVLVSETLTYSFTMGAADESLEARYSQR